MVRKLLSRTAVRNANFAPMSCFTLHKVSLDKNGKNVYGSRLLSSYAGDTWSYTWPFSYTHKPLNVFRVFS